MLVKMVLSNSVEKGIDFVDYRDICYYDKYQYRARFFLEGVRYTYWSKTEEEFLALLEPNSALPSWKKVRPKDKDKVSDNLENLLYFLNLRQDLKKTKTGYIRVEANRVSVFSNELEELHNLLSKFTNINCEFSKAETTGFEGVKYFKNEPPHNYRIYLKTRKYTDEEKSNLCDLLIKSNILFPSPALHKWLSKYPHWSGFHKWSSASHFIDYDDESSLTYLLLMSGKIFGKKYKLERRET